MAYTVKKLARLSGVSVRTLHFYDEIGLLKPAYYGDNKYRYYEEEQLLMLQQILFFRELGFQLNDILRIIGSNDFDKIEALKSHKLILKKSLDQKQKLIKTIDKTIDHLRGKAKMRDEEMFDSLRPHDAKKQKDYEKYLMDNGVMSQQDIDKSWEKVKDWKKVDWEKFKQDGEELNKELAKAMQNNLKPTDPEVQKLIRKHYDWVKNFWTPTKENYIGLGQLYCEHPDFQKYYDRYHPQFVTFLVEAMKVFAKRELS